MPRAATHRCSTCPSRSRRIPKPGREGFTPAAERVQARGVERHALEEGVAGSRVDARGSPTHSGTDLSLAQMAAVFTA